MASSLRKSLKSVGAILTVTTVPTLAFAQQNDLIAGFGEGIPTTVEVSQTPAEGLKTSSNLPDGVQVIEVYFCDEECWLNGERQPWFEGQIHKALSNVTDGSVHAHVQSYARQDETDPERFIAGRIKYTERNLLEQAGGRDVSLMTSDSQRGYVSEGLPFFRITIGENSSAVLATVAILGDRMVPTEEIRRSFGNNGPAPQKP